MLRGAGEFVRGAWASPLGQLPAGSPGPDLSLSLLRGDFLVNRMLVPLPSVLSNLFQMGSCNWGAVKISL